MKTSKSLAYGLGVLISLIYGFSCQGAIRYLEETSKSGLKDLFFVMSFGFVFLFPACLGSLTVYFATENQKRSILFLLFAPWITATISLVLSLIAGWEGTICLVLALPIYLIMGSLGGIITGIIFKYTANRPKLQFLSLGFLLFSPFISGFSENFFPLPTEIRKIHTQILIQAKPETIWSQITRIPTITEPQTGFFYLMGFPKPVEATLDKEEVGGIREAKFEKGLLFIETITVWEPNQKLRFSIRSDPSSTPLTTLDPHVVVGGRYFDTLIGEYRLEKISEKETLLHLWSRYRLSTMFNFYSGIWADFLMEDIQRNILRVLKTRCEKKEKI